MRRSTHSRYQSWLILVHGGNTSTPTRLEMCNVTNIACFHVESHCLAVQFHKSLLFREYVDLRIRDTNKNIIVIWYKGTCNHPDLVSLCF